MENFYIYLINNYILSPEARWIIDGLVVWAYDHYEIDGILNDEGIHFLETVIADKIGMEQSEIAENWKY